MTAKVNVKTQQERGIKLRQIRVRKNLSQEQVAKAAGYSITYYAGIERGEENPTITVLENICKALKINISTIVHS